MTVFKVGKKWKAQPYAGGRRLGTKTFDRKGDALLWEEKIIRKGVPTADEGRTFADLLDRYRREVTPHKTGKDWETKRIGFFERLDFAETRISDLTPAKIAEFRDARRQSVSGSTINRDFNLLSNVCRYAVKEWGWLAANPFSDVRRPKENPHRDSLVTDEQIEALRYAAGDDLTSISGRCVQAFRFSIETGLRAGEVLAMRRSTIFKDYVHVAAIALGERKSAKRDVALSPLARVLLDEILALGGDVWSLTASQLESNFRKLTKKAAIAGLTYHDSRHAACTRLARKLTPFELARMMGWKNLSMAMRYYNETASEIAKKLL